MMNKVKNEDFARGHGLTKKHVRQAKDKKVKDYIRKNEATIKEAANVAVKAQILQVESPGMLVAEGLEKTFRFKQKDICEHVPLASAIKVFDLHLDFGPYIVDYTLTGRSLLIGGSKGHVATFEWRTGKLLGELHLNETVYDVQWLHNESFYAVAQKKHVYVYDGNGLEVHSLKNHSGATVLDFLPYHMLLVSSGRLGRLVYQDVSTGTTVADCKARLGPTQCMTQNSRNAIMHLGHANGTVTLWSPNSGAPLIKMLCHRGPVVGMSVDRTGSVLATAGLDGQLKLWDLRTYRPLYDYYTPAAPTSLCFSQTGLLSVTFGSHIHVWKDVAAAKQKAPYMTHMIPGGAMRSSKFCPFDDVCALGHALGVSSILVPGSGEPNFDSLEANPFQTVKQRREAEIHTLLDKLPADTIALSQDYIGKLRNSGDVPEEEDQNVDPDVAARAKAKRGKRAAKRYLKKQSNVIDAKKQAIREKMKKERDLHNQKEDDMDHNKVNNTRWNPLDRFKPKA